jgi:ribosomal protein S19E (S16A)
MLDWVALQHLKQKGLVEDSGAGPKVTDTGRQALRDYPG